MFDLILGKAEHIPGGGGVPVLVSSAVHVGALGALIVLPLLFFTNVLPEVPTMMAFVAAAPAPPPPPPPPPPPQPQETATPKVVSSNPDAAPIEAPSTIEPEPAATTGNDGEGVVGGVEGGIPGGVVGGIVGGLPEAPPPPPPPPAPRGPVRVGGQIQPPTLVRRIEPIYPAIAVAAHIGGTVILEAIVDENGEVQNVRVLRSIPLLDKAAIAAVEQWRY